MAQFLEQLQIYPCPDGAGGAPRKLLRELSFMSFVFPKACAVEIDIFCSFLPVSLEQVDRVFLDKQGKPEWICRNGDLLSGGTAEIDVEVLGDHILTVGAFGEKKILACISRKVM